MRAGDVVALRLPSGADYLIAYGAAAKLGAITAGINPKLAGAEQEALVARVEPAVTLTEAASPTLPDHGADSRAARARSRPTGGDRVHVRHHRATQGRGCSATASSRPSPRIDLGPAADRWGGGAPILASHAVPPHRVDDQAAVVPPHRRAASSPWSDGAPTTCCAPWPSTASPPSAASRPRWRCCCARRCSTSSTSSCVQALVVGGAHVAARTGARRHGVASARRTRSATRRPSRAASVSAPRSTRTTTRRCTRSGRPRPGVEVRVTDGRRALPPVADAQVDGYWRDPEATAATIDAERLVAHRRPGRGRRATGSCASTVASRRCTSAAGTTWRRPRSRPRVGSPGGRRGRGGRPPRRRDGRGRRGAGRAARSGAAAPTLDELRSHAEDRLATWKLPEDWWSSTQLPLTAMQKIDRTALADLARLDDDMSDVFPDRDMPQAEKIALGGARPRAGARSRCPPMRGRSQPPYTYTIGFESSLRPPRGRHLRPAAGRGAGPHVDDGRAPRRRRRASRSGTFVGLLDNDLPSALLPVDLDGPRRARSPGRPSFHGDAAVPGRAVPLARQGRPAAVGRGLRRAPAARPTHPRRHHLSRVEQRWGGPPWARPRTRRSVGVRFALALSLRCQTPSLGWSSEARLARWREAKGT